MVFYGYRGITWDIFKEIMADNLNRKTGKLPSRLRSELERFVFSGRFERFKQAEGNRPLSAPIEAIIDEIYAMPEGKRSRRGYIKRSTLGDWFVELMEDGSIRTNIATDLQEMTELEDVWLGLNSVVGRKKDGSLVQQGSCDEICMYTQALDFVTSSTYDKKQWAVKLGDDNWIYFNGISTESVREARLNGLGEIEYEK